MTDFFSLIGLMVAFGLIGAGLAGVTITVFLHRGITHSSIAMRRPVYEVGRAMTWLTVFMRHWEWRRVHRKHHMYTDVWIDEIRHDPHSPIVITEREGINGYRRVSWHMAAIFHREASLPDIQDGTYDDASLDRPFDALDKTVFARPVYGAILMGVIYATLFALFTPAIVGIHRSVLLEIGLVVMGSLSLGVHIATVLRFGGAINSGCHRAKVETPGAGYATNVRMMSVLVFGEGEHLTHHLHPEIAQISKRWDLGWRVIQVLSAVRLVQVRVRRREMARSLVGAEA